MPYQQISRYEIQCKFSLHAQNIQVIFWSPLHLHIDPLLIKVVLNIVKLNMDFHLVDLHMIIAEFDQ